MLGFLLIRQLFVMLSVYKALFASTTRGICSPRHVLRQQALTCNRELGFTVYDSSRETPDMLVTLMIHTQGEDEMTASEKPDGHAMTYTNINASRRDLELPPNNEMAAWTPW